MTFIDALKTGRPMRRKGWGLYQRPNDDTPIAWMRADMTGEDELYGDGLRLVDYLADDWEVQLVSEGSGKVRRK